MPLLTIFSAPKPFTDPHIALIQRNAIQSWLALGTEVEVILVGEEEGLAETAQALGARHLPDVIRNSSGTPLVSSIFELARNEGQGQLLAYVNADILLLPDFVEAARQAAEQADHFLLVGQRWDLDVRQPLDFGKGWPGRLQDMLKTTGRLHTRHGSDYFIFPRACFTGMPDFAIGRAGWDNWMIYHARSSGWQTVDATESICIIHQDHDYRHLPGGQTHHRLPESAENVRLAGGRRTIFTLLDTNRRLVGNRLAPDRLSWQKFWREVEIFPLVHLHWYGMGQVFFAVFHPIKAWAELRAWLAAWRRRKARPA